MSKRRAKGQVVSVPRRMEMPVTKDPTARPEVVDLDRNIVAAAADFADQEAKHKLVFRYADAEADRQYGAALTLAEAEEAAIKMQHEAAVAALQDTDKKLAAEPLQIPTTKANGGNTGPGEVNKETRFRHWQSRDQFAGVLIIFAILALLAASYAGIQATLADAGLPIFEEQKHLPFMLSVLAPAAGIAIKQATGVFNDPASKDLYRKIITAIGILAFFLWVPLFASLFEGLSGVFDPFKETNHFIAWGFNVGHIIAEALISAALFFQLDALMAKYAPSDLIDNEARPPLERFRVKQVEAVETLAIRLGEVQGRIRELRALYEEAHVLVEAAILQRESRQRDDGLL